MTMLNEEIKDSIFKRVCDSSSDFIEELKKENTIFPTILSLMKDGNASIELRKRYILRAIDQVWIETIEESLPYLDTIIRNPSKFLEENEEVIPIEMARNISVRSLQHLSQHTNYISKIEGDEITPSKILNVWRDETMMTYENKFINTLIHRLYAFVNMRYEIAKNAGQDTKTSTIEFKEEFMHDKAKVKVNLMIEMEESAENDQSVERNYTYSSSLWKRLVKLNKIMSTYVNSTFCMNMGKAFIRPPVMRTNAILKNKNLRQCLALWRFIENYENAGYNMLIQENLENVDDMYIKELYENLALQYLMFRYNIKNEFEGDETLANEITDNVLNPRIVDELKDLEDEDLEYVNDLNYYKERNLPSYERLRYQTLSPEDELILMDLKIALDAANIIRESGEEYLYSNSSIIDPGLFDEDEEEKEDEDEEY